MWSDQWLSLSLLLALCSNALLLLVISFKAFNNDGEQPQQPQCCPPQEIHARQQDRKTLSLVTFSNYKRGSQPDPEKNPNVGESIRFIVGLPERQDQGSLHANQVWQVEREESTSAYDSVDKTGENGLNKKIGLFYRLYRQLSKIDPKFYLSKKLNRNDKFSRKVYESLDSRVSPGTFKTDRPSPHQRERLDPLKLSEATSGLAESLTAERESTLGKHREKRDSALLDAEAGADGNYLNYEYQFSKLTDNETLQFSAPVSSILVPGLVKFEERMVR